MGEPKSGFPTFYIHLFDCRTAKRFSSFLYSGEQHQQTRTQTKKRWGPALWQPSWGLGNGWSLPQERNSASSNKKFAHIKKRKSVNHNTESTQQDAPHKAANKKAACRKETVEPLYYTSIQRNKEHLSCMRRIDRKRRPLAGGNAVGQPPTGGGRSLGCQSPQFTGYCLGCGFLVCVNAVVWCGSLHTFSG